MAFEQNPSSGCSGIIGYGSSAKHAAQHHRHCCCRTEGTNLQLRDGSRECAQQRRGRRELRARVTRNGGMACCCSADGARAGEGLCWRSGQATDDEDRQRLHHPTGPFGCDGSLAYAIRLSNKSGCEIDRSSATSATK